MKREKIPRNKAVVPSAGQRRDLTRSDNNSAVTLDDNLKEEMAWRREHKQ